MSNDNSQQAPQAAQIAGTTPIPGPTIHAALDSAALPQGFQSPAGGRDYQASFEGLQRRYQADVTDTRQAVAALEQRLTQQADQLSQILNRLNPAQPQSSAPTQAQPAAQPAPAATPAQGQGQPATPAATAETLMQQAMQMQAQTQRDMIILEMAREGQPGHGLPIETLRDHVPIVPPTQGANGQLDYSGQRAAVQRLIDALRGTQAQQQAQAGAELAAGRTPGGSVPAAPPSGSTQQQAFERFQHLKGYLGSPEARALPQPEKDKLFKEYYDLLSRVGHLDPAVSMPYLNAQDVFRQVQTLTNSLSPAGGRIMG